MTSRLRRVAWVGLAAGGWALGPAQARVPRQEPVFSTRVEVVRVDVSVREGGRPIRGLNASDFEVLDNGVPQDVRLIGLGEAPVNVVLALDMSGSVQGTRLAQLRSATETFLAALEPDDTAALVTFTDLVTIASPFTADRDGLMAGLDAPVRGVDTALADAAYAAIVLGQSAPDRPLVIVFSDGVDTASFLTADLVLDAARRTGPAVYAVSFPQAAKTLLDDLVPLTGGRRLNVDSLAGLSEAFTEILRESRERYLLSYTPTGVQPAGWHELTVRVRGRGAEVRARPGYLMAR